MPHPVQQCYELGSMELQGRLHQQSILYCTVQYEILNFEPESVNNNNFLSAPHRRMTASQDMSSIWSKSNFLLNYTQQYAYSLCAVNTMMRRPHHLLYNCRELKQAIERR